MKAAIVIDAWKLEIFERHLNQAGYVYKLTPGPMANNITITVVTNNGQALGEVAKAANTEAAKTGPTK